MEEFIIGQVRTTGHRRVAHSLYRRLSGQPEDAATQLNNDLAAWQFLLGGEIAFTHLTGASGYGLWLPPLPRGVPTFVVTRGARRIRRPGVVASRLVGTSDFRRRGRVLLDAPVEVLLRCARDLGTLDVTVMVVSALRHGLVTPSDLDGICASRRPGVKRLRAAVGLADPRCESAGEVLLYALHVIAEIRVTPQAPLVDAHGATFGRADLKVIGTPYIHEYDGAVHRSAGQHAQDLRRERRLSELGIVRRGFVLPDLTRHPAVTMAELDRAMGRRFSRSRLDDWRRLIEESLWSDAGVTRLPHRWIHRPGDTDWSRTAGLAR